MIVFQFFKIFFIHTATKTNQLHAIKQCKSTWLKKHDLKEVNTV